MPCAPEVLRNVVLFSLLDDDEIAILATHVEIRDFAPRQRIYRIGDPGERAYVVVTGGVEVTTIDEDKQEVMVQRPGPNEFFGFASMINETAHETNAMATEATVCIEIDRHDIFELLKAKPHAGMDMLAILGRQFHAAQGLVRLRSARSANELIEDQNTWADDLADEVARFGGSWRFIILFGTTLVVYAGVNILLRGRAWDPYPFILLNLFLSMLAAIQAPVIMMSQNRQDKKDRVRSELDFQVNRRAESEIQGLAHKLRMLDDKLDDVTDLLRAKNPASARDGK